MARQAQDPRKPRMAGMKAPAAAPPDGRPRARILAAADRLFYRDGINSVGVETLANEARVTKRTLYHHFASKEDLIAAYIGGRIAPPRLDPERPAREQILRAFAGLAKAFENNSFRGCAFINAAAELSDSRHPAVALARQAKEMREAWFRELATAGGARDPAALGAQLAIVLDGTIAQFLVRRDRQLAETGAAAAAALMDAAGL